METNRIAEILLNISWLNTKKPTSKWSLKTNLKKTWKKVKLKIVDRNETNMK